MTTFDATVSAAQFASVAPAGGIVRFRGEAGRFWRLLARGAVLLMATLGIYGFWLTTDIRRFLWSHTELAGESFEYTGTAFGLGELASLIGHMVLTLLGQYRRLGAAIERQMRASLDTHHTGAAFECGNGEKEKPGRAAFDKLMRQIERGADLPVPLIARVVRQRDANAITLPGGYIYVFEGLLDKAKTPDELAGVIAHEIGHVAHRDGTRTVLQAAGLSLLFGILLGDFVGGGAVVFAAKIILQTSYSRAAESAADEYGVALIDKIGGDPRGLGRLLSQIAGTTHPGPKLLLDHPETGDRVAQIEKMASSAPRRALLEQSEWAALKTICAGT
jgi:Zn-dependent protease with chaperone function